MGEVRRWDEIGEEPLRRDLRVSIHEASGHEPDATRRLSPVPCHHHRMAKGRSEGVDSFDDWDLPVKPPVSPMLASPAGDALPERVDLAFEPKWDGFRMLAFRAGDRILLQGRSGDDLTYAFPEVAAALLDTLPERVVLDGEAVVVRDGTLDFTAMGSRLRPRSDSGTIERLSRDVPATYVAFDMLALGNRSLVDDSYLSRREHLETLGRASSAVAVTPMTQDRDLASRWFHAFEGAGLDGLIAKPQDAPYAPGKRSLLKIKHRRTLDVVVAGWRGHAKDPGEVGSLLLGLFDEQGRLHHVGSASGFNASRRREITAHVASFAMPADTPHPWTAPERGMEGEGVRRPGEINRWNRGRDHTWNPLTPELVAEVAYDQFEGNRLRHVATWLRWRPDRAAASCTYDQVAVPTPVDVTALLT